MSESLVITRSTKSVDECCRALEEAVQAHGFGVMHVHDVKRTLESKGFSFEPAVRIFDVCSPPRAKRVLDADLALSAALPCAISVYGDDGGTCLAFVRPTAILGALGVPGLEPVATEVEGIMREIVTEAAGPRPA